MELIKLSPCARRMELKHSTDSDMEHMKSGFQMPNTFLVAVCINSFFFFNRFYCFKVVLTRIPFGGWFALRHLPIAYLCQDMPK